MAVEDAETFVVVVGIVAPKAIDSSRVAFSDNTGKFHVAFTDDANDDDDDDDEDNDEDDVASVDAVVSIGSVVSLFARVRSNEKLGNSCSDKSKSADFFDGLNLIAATKFKILILDFTIPNSL